MLCHHGQMFLNTGPVFGSDETREEWALLDRTTSNLPGCPICGQFIQEGRPILLRECVRERSSHPLRAVPRFGTSGIQFSRIAGKLGNALDLLICVVHRFECNAYSRAVHGDTNRGTRLLALVKHRYPIHDRRVDTGCERMGTDNLTEGP